MIVYGDHARVVAGSDVLAEISGRLARARATEGGAGLDQWIAAVILAGQLQQALEDREMDGRGFDELSAVGEAAGALTLAVAKGASVVEALENLRGLCPQGPLSLSQPEGYAFYGVQPSAYFEAAREVRGSLGAVLGLRSIGTSLGAMVAAGAGVERVFTVRPVGHPFDRRIEASKALLSAVTESDGPIAIVDEGPGLSGSSFAAAADWLETAGVVPERLVFFPSHSGAPGPKASARHRERWDRARRIVPPPMETAYLDEASAHSGQVEDLSGGAWRDVLRVTAPADPARERLKRRVRTGEGRALLKFAGYGEIGERKLAMAQALHAAGLGPRTTHLVGGFLLTAWIEGRPGLDGMDRAALISRTGRYLAFRAEHFLAPTGSGASLATLVDMARTNLAEAGLAHAAAKLDEYDPEAMSAHLRPVLVDGRMHPWEWIVDPDGRLLKLDAVDHHAGHDLVGAQDIAWDLAAAVSEFELSEAERADLLAAYDHPVDREILDLHRLLYLGFQIGLWTLAREQAQAADKPAIDALLAKYGRAL